MYGLIYKVTNKINGKTYIGQTTRSLKDRVNSHVSDLKKNMNIAFHNALRKYGTDCFVWEEIDTADTRDSLNEKEIFWIIETKSYIYADDSNGYNMTLGGEGGTGHVVTEEHRKIISEAQKLVNRSGENNPMYSKKHSSESIDKNKNSQPARKGIIQLTLDGEFVKKHDSVSDGARAVNGDRSAIKKVCKGIQSQHKGFLWMLEDDYKGEV